MPLVDILSAERFSTYLTWAEQDAALAERLYSFNVQLSADFYSSLHMLEIALRNKCDVAITKAYGAAWLQNPSALSDSYQNDCVRQATANINKNGRTVSHGQLISKLTLGFWSSLFGSKSNHLWGQTLRPLFNTPGLKRKDIAGKLRDLRRLRNRIAHYEPILAQPLSDLHTDILNLTAWMSVEAAAWITTHSTVAYPATQIIIQDPQTSTPIFDKALIGHLPR